MTLQSPNTNPVCAGEEGKPRVLRSRQLCLEVWQRLTGLEILPSFTPSALGLFELARRQIPEHFGASLESTEPLVA